MAERTVDEAAGDLLALGPTAPLVPDGALLVLLVVDGVLLGAFGLVFTPLYTDGIPVPMGSCCRSCVLPWLVRQAGEIDARPAVAGAPLTAWAVAVGVLGLVGPGGDVHAAGDLAVAGAGWSAGSARACGGCAR